MILRTIPVKTSPFRKRNVKAFLENYIQIFVNDKNI